MVGLVLVSHSNKLANATLSLVRAMSGDDVKISVAAGVGENNEDLGTDAMEIHQAIIDVLGSENNSGVVVIMDMGSAVISANIALDFLESSDREKVRLCSSAFVEGAIVAGVACKIGSNIDSVVNEAKLALKQKTEHIEDRLSNNFSDISNKEIPNTVDYITKNITIPIPNGLHMRPVTELVRIVGNYNSDIKIKNLSNGKGPVSARSMTEVLSIEALYNNDIQITASGDDAEKALSELIKAVNSGLGDSLIKDDNPKTNIQNKPVGISRGIAIANAYYLEHKNILIPKEKSNNPNEEIEKSKNSILKTKEELLNKSKSSPNGDIFKAQIAILEDPSLINKANNYIFIEKLTASSAWNISLDEIIIQYQNLKDENLRQRALDLMDLKQIILKNLGLKEEKNEKIHHEKEIILITKDLSPNQVYSLDTNVVKGVICIENAPSSHSSILLRSRGIPSVIQAKYADFSLENLPKDTIIAIDGESGEIMVNPNNNTLKNLKEKQNLITKQKLIEKQNSLKPAITKDEKTIEISANVGKAEDSQIALENGAEGIGLLRTEFMFIDKEAPPTENQQVESLYNILQNMSEKPITIRTLDAGGDKNIPYLNLYKEENPFLGIRAIRISLKNEKMFQQQLRAILRVGKDFNTSIMFPMISTMSELLEAKKQLYIAHKALKSENISHKWPIKTGIMVEVPSVAILAEDFAKEVDFFSIGTNDLIQYTMAMDRGNPAMHDYFGGELDKSVQQIIKNVVNSAEKAGIPVSVCGEIASDPKTVPILLRLGIRKLSMNPSSIPQIKHVIREISSM